MNAPTPWNATLHLEVRSKGKPGRPNIERRVYTGEIRASAADPNSAEVHMVRSRDDGHSVSFSTTSWQPSEFDPQARTSVFRESLRRSDRLVDELERFGWTRRPDLEEGQA
ncbi:hypothetical protein QOL99_00290 [Deinococcus sp. MIMF12]|uniref:Uncharacterized protein n=1 Tax=Deinococcus rhizophilus TaxID=3049544 RepID=A0ABT7JDG2_9DEIO|nr:hypothetical protein [Deinococcus rhizophilus]MDL2342587.1 hypothetical protein [Deinococcus rhizophilus]